MRIYIAMVRVTEVSWASCDRGGQSYHPAEPSRASLWRAILDVRLELTDDAPAVFGYGDVAPGAQNSSARRLRSRNRRASALFEDGEVRTRSNSLRLNAALVDVRVAVQLFGAQLGILRPTAERIEARIDDALSEAAPAARAWRTGGVDVVA